MGDTPAPRSLCLGSNCLLLTPKSLASDTANSQVHDSTTQTTAFITQHLQVVLVTESTASYFNTTILTFQHLRLQIPTARIVFGNPEVHLESILSSSRRFPRFFPRRRLHSPRGPGRSAGTRQADQDFGAARLPGSSQVTAATYVSLLVFSLSFVSCG